MCDISGRTPNHVRCPVIVQNGLLMSLSIRDDDLDTLCRAGRLDEDGVGEDLTTERAAVETPKGLLVPVDGNVGVGVFAGLAVFDVDGD